MNRLLFILCSLLIAGLTNHALAQDAPKREITQIAGDLYRFQNNFHFSVFMVTPEGIIATDPINKEAAEWLKAELQQRFDQPVKYLIYSHDHADHIAGGEVFDDEAIVVAHDNAREVIVGEQRPTAVPEVTFSERMTIELGGKTVELIYVGPSHSDNMIAMYFPDEKTVFAVDFISVKRLPYQNLSDSYFPGWIDAIKVVEALDFEILAPGHGPLGSKADATEHRQYMEDLYDAVLSAAREGQTLEEMKESIKLVRYEHFGQFADWLPLNIEGIYQRIQLQRRGN